MTLAGIGRCPECGQEHRALRTGKVCIAASEWTVRALHDGRVEVIIGGCGRECHPDRHNILGADDALSLGMALAAAAALASRMERATEN